MEKRRGKGIPWRKVRAVKSGDKDKHEHEDENERSVIAVLVYINQLSIS